MFVGAELQGSPEEPLKSELDEIPDWGSRLLAYVYQLSSVAYVCVTFLKLRLDLQERTGPSWKTKCLLINNY